MDCNKEEALRAKDIAEKKMENRDFVGARKIALKAQHLYPDLENIAQILVVCDVHCSAEQKSFGNEKDWYAILQVEQTAGDAIIKKQYRKFALLLHPDKNKFSGAEAAFKLIGEAQRVLLDREKRSLYDMKRRVQMNKPSTSGFNNSTMRSNVRPNFTSSNAQKQQQQQQPKQQAQQQRNGAHPTFWTVCPFCSVRYQYYKEILKRSLRCQNCHRPFVAYEVDKQGKSSPATNSTRQASDQQKDGLNHGVSSAGSQGNSHAEKSNTGPNDKKGPTNVSGKPNGKRKRKQVEESSKISDSMSTSDSEGDVVAGKGDFSSVENHSSFRKEYPRRSPRKKHEVSYKESVSYKENGKSHGETIKMNDQDGLASDVKGERKEGKQKQHLYSEESLFNRNEETKTVKPKDAVGGSKQMGLASGVKGERKEGKQKQHLYSVESLFNRNEETKTVKAKDAVGGSKQMDETSNHSPDSTSNAASHPNVYVYPDAQFSDFDKDKKKECFATGQIWAVYDTADGMPRFYALIRKVLSPEFKLQITWFEPHPGHKDEISWVNEQLPVACGKYKLGNTDITDDHLMFSHLVLLEKLGCNTFEVYPRKGETWALFKNWDIKWYLDVESHQLYEFEFVEILTDYVEGEGVYVAYLAQLEGFVSLFSRNMNEENKSIQIPPVELFRFSHRVPSFKLTGEEGVGVPTGSYELDTAALPVNLDDVAVTGNFDVKVGHGSFGSENTRSSDRSEPLMTSDRDAFIPRVNLERSNFATGNENSVDDSDNSSAPAASNSETIEIPDTQFFDFDTGRSLEKFQIGQIWAFYSDEDGLPRYYGHINKIEKSPDLQLHVSWLTCYWLPDNAIKWEDRDMLISSGRFKVNKTDEFLSVYSSISSVSHQVHAEVVGKNNKNYAIFPRKGEVWALYRKWTNKIKCFELKNWEVDIVEVVEETDLFINVLVLEFVSGYSSLFRGKSNEGSSVNIRIPRKELLRFSHQIPAFKLTEKHGNLRGFWELDPGALPVHYHSLR